MTGYDNTSPTALSDFPRDEIPGRMELHPELIKRILVIKLRHFGDVLLITPLLSTLRINYHNALIDVLLYKHTDVMLRGNTNINHIYTVDRCLKKQGFIKQFTGERQLAKQLCTGHYDLVINLSDQWRAALYCAFLRPGFSLAFCYPRRRHRLWKICHSHLVGQIRKQHTVLHNLSILTPLALREIVTTVTQSWHPCDADNINRICEAHGLEDFVLIQPTARWAFKTWTTSGFSAVINALTDRGITVVLTGGPEPEDIAMINAIISGCMSTGMVVNLAGSLTLPELAVLIERATLFVGVDSVAMHMAAALKTPSVVLFGPSDVDQWHPWQSRHTLIWAGDYRSLPAVEAVDTSTDERYLSAIPVHDVIRAIEQQLQG